MFDVVADVNGAAALASNTAVLGIQRFKRNKQEIRTVPAPKSGTVQMLKVVAPVGATMFCLIENYLTATAFSIWASRPSVPLKPTAATTFASCSAGSAGFGNASTIGGTSGTAPERINSRSFWRLSAQLTYD